MKKYIGAILLACVVTLICYRGTAGQSSAGLFRAFAMVSILQHETGHALGSILTGGSVQSIYVGVKEEGIGGFTRSKGGGFALFVNGGGYLIEGILTALLLCASAYKPKRRLILSSIALYIMFMVIYFADGQDTSTVPQLGPLPLGETQMIGLLWALFLLTLATFQERYLSKLFLLFASLMILACWVFALADLLTYSYLYTADAAWNSLKYMRVLHDSHTAAKESGGTAWAWAVQFSGVSLLLFGLIFERISKLSKSRACDELH